VAIKTAVSGWFNDKVESVLRHGPRGLEFLTRGGISLAKVGQMAWERSKRAIPGVLIALLIEKLVSMIIPGGGAILAIHSRASRPPGERSSDLAGHREVRCLSCGRQAGQMPARICGQRSPPARWPLSTSSPTGC